MTTNSYHQPVLLQECIDGLNIQANGVYVDVTFGGGGHSKAILNAMHENCKLFAFDQDPDAAANVPEDARLTFIPQNFSYLKNFLRVNGISEVDGIMADLGVSSHQLDEGARGFSFKHDGELDMRMNTRAGENAAELLKRVTENDLRMILRNYGEVENPGKVARAIIMQRQIQPIQSTSVLKNLLSEIIPQRFLNKELAKIFQALRIEVNQEMESLKQFLMQSGEVLKSGGRLVVISYHSLEDRLVKDFIRSGNFEGKIEKDFYGNPLVDFEAINKKPILPSAEEIENNPRSRSAKLRIAVKK